MELLDAAAKQPQRGRFASRQGAVSVVRRPSKHVVTLIAAGLVDEAADKRLTMHDWDEWQKWRKEDANDSPTTPERPPNGHSNDTRTTTEQLRNGPPPRARVAREGDTEGEGDVEEDVERDEDVTPTTLRSGTPPRVAKPQKARRPISNETIERLVAEYGPRFGDPEIVRDWISRALNHTQRLKALDEALYVERTWLKPELAKLTARAAVADQGCTCDEVRANLAINRNSYPNCEVHGRVEFSATQHPNPRRAA
ncbi:MAG TPA: hypothetical protein VIR57_19130 [Chloroflexota bacterium]